MILVVNFSIFFPLENRKYQLNHIQRIWTKFCKHQDFSFNKSRGYIDGCVSLNSYRFYAITLVFIKIVHSFYLFVFKCALQFCFKISNKFSPFWFTFMFLKESRASRYFLVWLFIVFFLADLNGSSYLTFAISCWKLVQFLALTHLYLQN